MEPRKGLTRREFEVTDMGDDFNQDIIEYMGRMHNLRIDEPTAERIKIQVGSALPELEDAPEDFVVVGPNKVTALPMSVPVSYQEISHCLEKSVSKIEHAILQALETTPPELYSDIVKRGIYLTGGGALLRELDKLIEKETKIPVHSVRSSTADVVHHEAYPRP